MTYEQFIRNSGYWNRMNQCNGFSSTVNLDEDLKDMTIECLREIGILDTEMNGNSIVRLPRNNNAENGGAINYSELFTI